MTCCTESSQNIPEALFVNVVDPVTKGIWPGQLIQKTHGYVLERSVDRQKPAELFLSPGWIDIHAHVYHGVGNLSIPADTVGLSTGVHLIADAGSAGEETITGFERYVAPACSTAIKAWLNISSVGLAFMPEVSDIAFIDVEKTIRAAGDHRPFVCGIKVRSEKNTVGSLGLQPVKLAAAAARAAGLPLMVHIGAPPPCIEDILDLLIAGDVVTHCYHGKTCPPWLPDGNPIPAMRKALARGVLLDVGHGVSSFSFEIAKKAIAAGFPPFSIGTDAHALNLAGPVYDLPTTMAKMLAAGMGLIDVIGAVTAAPAQILQLKDWCDLNGELNNATLFRLSGTAPAGRTFTDTVGRKIAPERYILPAAVLTGQGLTYI
ncbi:MAG: amidohydrolase/deacetylase family metallohydrolase [Negativicutes bacterium]|nr:amidohydrolase/deacetylase family metallohydrolase [Negativicutes bacterium]